MLVILILIVSIIIIIIKKKHGIQNILNLFENRKKTHNRTIKEESRIW